MPSYSARPGERVDITVRGYVTYNTGGFLNISDKPLVEGEPEEGSARLDIPEWMVVAEPVAAPLWPNGALLLVREPGRDRSPMLVQYVDEDGIRGFRRITDPEPHLFTEREFLVGRDPATFERLRREGEED